MNLNQKKTVCVIYVRNANIENVMNVSDSIRVDIFDIQNTCEQLPNILDASPQELNGDTHAEVLEYSLTSAHTNLKLAICDFLRHQNWIKSE